jgi:hypothetical protein
MHSVAIMQVQLCRADCMPCFKAPVGCVRTGCFPKYLNEDIDHSRASECRCLIGTTVDCHLTETEMGDLTGLLQATDVVSGLAARTTN